MRLNLHLFSNEKFVEGAILQFEKFHPGDNVYVVNSDKEIHYNIIPDIAENVFFSNFENAGSSAEVKKIALKFNVKCVFIHYLDYLKAGIVLKLKETLTFKTFWIFYGADFYSQITDRFSFFDYVHAHSKKKSSIIKKSFNSLKYIVRYRITGKKAIQKVISELDFFCFWNKYELENVKKYFICNAEFKWFLYTAAMNFGAEIEASVKDENILLINHSASKWSNHLTIIEKVLTQNAQYLFNEILIPLSYGEKFIRDQVIEYCNNKEIQNTHFLSSFLPSDEYFEKLRGVTVAAFGAKRQEGAGNIFFLLRNGTRVFLRSENPLLNFLKGKGFKVFSFEDDMNDNKNFEPLSMEDQKNNIECYESIFNNRNVEVFMKDLLV